MRHVGTLVGARRDWLVVRKSAITRGKKVAQYTLDGEYVQTFLTATDAAHSVGRKCNSLIIRCCKSDKYTAYGYIWRYAS